ncbi:TonB-dependent receptor [Flavobacterium sp.]|uniref:TonB-dependent receptor domain-containing protein n=1 Tax=Flavobacterium sp. TaxID=239 RepID=UPI0024877364|nr:TonB-dependent receptor [Flavobacterium sp.]MDI1316082.1 TonB-dependent receptor [Flavobacterium sp.]
MKSVLFTTLFLAATSIFAQETPNATVQDTIKKPKTNELQEVTISQQRKFMKIESDKTTIAVKDNAMLSTGNAYDAVKKLPGVIASPTGGLSLNGKGVTIYIDGAPSTLTGTDLQNYLSSLPANAIEKVELVYNPGAAYDANASGSVINLVTSSKRLKGVNASFNINYNFNKYQKPSPQILLNGKEKNLSWQTMIGYNYIDSEQRSTNGQTFTSFDPDKFINQDRLTVATNRNLYARLGTNYKLTSKSNLLFNYNATFSNDRNVFDGKTTGSEIPDYLNDGINKTKSSNHEISLQFKTKLDTIGRTLDVTAFTNTFNQDPNTLTNAVENNVSSFNNFRNNFALLNYYLKYDFAIPFEKIGLSLNTGGKFNTIKVENTGFYNLNSATTDVIDFDYKETNLAFYTEVRKKFKKLNLTAGLRYEDFNVNRIGMVDATRTNIDFKNRNLFPNFSALYEFTDNINISTSYSRKISQPSYSVLDPNGGNFDQYNTSTGNLLLNPSFYDNFELKMSAFQYVQIGANYTVAQDHNLFIFNAEPGETVSTQTFQQFDRFKTFTAYANFPIPLDYFFKGKEAFQKRMTNIDKMNYIFFNVTYIKNVTDGYNFSFESKPIWNYAAQAQIMLPWDIKSYMNYFILPAGGVWEIYKIKKDIQQFDISFNKDFWNKKLKVGVHAFDVFNQNEINALISSTNLQTKFYKKDDSRTFRISLTYNFGNLKIDKENTTINTEKVESGGSLVK